MADQLNKVVTRKLLKQLDLKSKTGEPMKDAVLDVGHTGKLAESDKRSFDLLSQHIDLGDKLPMVIKPDKNGAPTVEFSGFDATKAQLLKDRIENDPKFFDTAVDELAANKNAPFVKMVDVDPEFRRPLVPEDVRLLSRQESSDPKSNFATPRMDAWFQRTQQNGWWGTQGKNFLGSFFGRGYNEAAQDYVRDPKRFYAGSRFTNWVADKAASVGGNLVSIPTLTGAVGAGVGISAWKGRMNKEEAANDVLNKNSVVAAQERLLRQGLDDGHVTSADWSDRESTMRYTKNSKYANRWVLEDSFSDVIQSNYGGKLKRLYESNATEALQNLRRAYSERVKGLPDGKIAIFNDKGVPIQGEKGKDNREVVDLQKFEQGIQRDGGVFVPVEDRSSQDMENRGLLAEDGNHYVAMLYVPSKESRSKITNDKKLIKDKEAEGKPVSKVKTRAEIAAELDKGKGEEEPAAQWVFVNVAKKGTDAIYRDANGDPAKPKFK
jgi:hypothetical protein